MYTLYLTTEVEYQCMTVYAKHSFCPVGYSTSVFTSVEMVEVNLRFI